MTMISKGYRTGCIGWVARTHADHYSDLVGFGLSFESKVAGEMSEFCLRHDEGKDGLWLAMAAGEFMGSVAIDGPTGDDDLAHLRWFIVSDQARGSGLGRVLLATAVNF